MEFCCGRMPMLVLTVVVVVVVGGVEGEPYAPSIKTTPSSSSYYSSTSSSVKTKEQCALGREMVMGGGDGRAVMVVLVVGGLGAGAARRSCHAHGATPFFLNTQEDANILRSTLKDCVKTERLGSLWVPARRHASHKGVERPADSIGVPARGNLEYDWMSALYNRTSDTIMLFPFPPKSNIRRRGIICERKDDE